MFGPIPIHKDQIFLTSDYSYGIVNIKPIVKGHVLILPKSTNCVRFSDLSKEEIKFRNKKEKREMD